MDRQFDKRLGIRTVGLREWPDQVTEYNRYEATPYKALESLFNQYKLEKTDQVVDFGSGRGRVAFYIHNRFHVPVTGVEMHDKTFTEALDNKTSYRQKAGHIEAPINFEYGLAEDYQIKPWENRFYFFNPFSHHIFKKVVKNIVASIKKHERPADIILYYPLSKYKQILTIYTPFKIMNKVQIPGEKEKIKKFIIYRCSP